MPNRQPYTFDRVVRIVFSICIVLTVIWMLDVLRGVLLPFLVACLIAYMLEPIVRWNQRWTHSKRRFIPVVLTLVEALCLVGIFCWIFIPYLVSECKEMARLISAYASREIQIPYISDKIHKFIRDNVDFDTLSRYLTRDQWIELAKTSLSKTWSFVSSGVAVVAAMVSWLIVILYVIFIMLDYERLMLSFRQLVPYRHRKTAFRIFDDIKNSMNRYRGRYLTDVSFISPYCPYLPLSRKVYHTSTDALTAPKPIQNHWGMPHIYITTNRMKSAMRPPAKMNRYWAFRPLYSTVLPMPLLIV